ncbi:S41 family peptidase [Dyadobacter jiangsuensis]|uniref:Peptidase S41-like protein n=1 Tax=Dyadobacter jiangsuensis TaxID=1591085 RepID=A0A2P8GJV2_9BACT|nr:S41 family peptidase [Dyadobacter jiangsuensis]PSL34231.1 peptidase S41-like protein [Dyadobacter jiangsuensis]
MRYFFTTALCALSMGVALAQQPSSTDFNLNFEKTLIADKLPAPWMEWGKGYKFSPDTTEKYQGKASLRIQSPEVMDNIQFGSAANPLPADYSGKEIELRGYMKFRDVGKGFAGLMMRIDGKSGMLQFNNMQGENLRGTQDWKQYSIKLPYPSGADKIYIGALLVGPGTLWVDQFELLIDGKPFTEAPPKKIYAAELDKEFDGGSKLALGPGYKLSKEQATSLAQLGRIWGFVKYHHPAVANGNFNMDYELFRVAAPYIAAKNDTERQQVIGQWLSKFGPIRELSPEAIPADAVIKPDLAWLAKSGDALPPRLDSIRRAARTDEHYYIASYIDVGNPEFKNENPYAEMAYPDAGFRLLSLFRYWNMIEYFFPYKPLIHEDWQAVLEEFVPRFVTAANETEYKLAALALITRVKDSHANLNGNHEALDKYFGQNFAPVQLSFIEGKPVVIDYFNAQLGKQTGLKPGDVIETINGKGVKQIIAEKKPYTPGSNPVIQLKTMAPNLLRSNDSTIAITFKRAGKVQKANISVYPRSKVNTYANYNKKDTCFKMIGQDVAYIFPGKFKNSYLPALAPQIGKSKGLIVDMRCYPSDFMVFSFGPMLLPEAKPFAKFTVGNFKTPGVFTWTPELKLGKTNPDHYKGKVIVIVNENSVSQSEFTTMAFAAAPNVTVIGSTTAGADGDISHIVLPGGLRTSISGIGVYYPDGRETQRIGIVPQVEVKPTIQGIADGRDEPLEKALQLIHGK